jgi:predicted MFS family arabinose efflux permease
MTTRLTPGLVLLLATVAGLSVANIYYNQPILGLIAQSFTVPGALAAQVAAATQIGYALGLVLLVPLGDAVDRRGLILWQSAGLVVALISAAVAPSLPALLLASVGIGIASTIAQQIIPIVAELAEPKRRGRMVGTVMSGLLAGILLARTISGAVGAAFGWRPMFWLGAVVALGMAAALAAFLPATASRHRQSYGRLLTSLVVVVCVYRPLRRAALVQALLFAGFSAFWATLTLLLASPAYNLGPAVAGLFGVIGMVGVCVAPLAGSLSDRRGPDGVTRLGVLGVLASFLVFGFMPGLAGLVLGVVLLDAGLQLAMVSQQSIILALDDAARARINTVFVTALFLGGAIGSAGASVAWQYAGWPGVSAYGALLALLALIVHRWGFRAPEG